MNNEINNETINGVNNGYFERPYYVVHIHALIGMSQAIAVYTNQTAIPNSGYQPHPRCLTSQISRCGGRQSKTTWPLTDKSITDNKHNSSNNSRSSLCFSTVTLTVSRVPLPVSHNINGVYLASCKSYLGTLTDRNLQLGPIHSYLPWPTSSQRHSGGHRFT